MSSAEDGPCLTAHSSGCLLRVVVTPNAPRTGADGLHDGCLRVRLNAPPVDGKANAALQGWLAAELGLPKRAVQLLHGQTVRRKQFVIDAPLAAVQLWLRTQLNETAESDAKFGAALQAGGRKVKREKGAA